MATIVLILAILIFIAILRKGIPTLHGHWNTLIDEFDYSTQDFYERLTKELKSHEIKNLRIKTININTGGAFSVRRLYLRVRWKNLTYDCCCAPYGNGTFISWFMYSELTTFQSLISKIPVVGSNLARALFPITYYKIDTASMFRSYAQSSVLKVIDDITNNKGVRALTAEERKPILRDIFTR